MVVTSMTCGDGLLTARRRRSQPAAWSHACTRCSRSRWSWVRMSFMRWMQRIHRPIA